MEGLWQDKANQTIPALAAVHGQGAGHTGALLVLNPSWEGAAWARGSHQAQQRIRPQRKREPIRVSAQHRVCAAGPSGAGNLFSLVATTEGLNFN